MAVPTITIPRTRTMSSETSSFDVISSQSSNSSSYDDGDSDQIVYSVSASITSQRIDEPTSAESDGNWSFLTAESNPVSRSMSFDSLSSQDLSLAMSGLALSEAPSRAVHSEGRSHVLQSATTLVARRPAQASAPTSPSNSQKAASRRKRKSAASAARSSGSVSQPLSPIVNQVGSPKKKKTKAKKAKKAVQMIAPAAKKQNDEVGLGERGIVDDVSEIGDESTVVAAYEGAKKYISSFLSNPHSADKLMLLQALIVELGLYTKPSSTPPSSSFWTLPDLPRSLKQAKAFLKSSVFLNVKDYVAVREHGQAALKRVMHPNRRSLMLELRKKERRAPRDWVKKMGLNVLLIQAF